ncbi:MAG: TonB-dependent receptor, partial [Xanthomonadales bacterium]|nr:TonB-dependent receptor [Xanthomonadales bacterium]
GPQGTLFGASAMGGAIRAVTNQPDPSGASHWLDVRYADIAHGGESIQVSAMLNQPVGDDSAVRLVAYRLDEDGFIDDILLDENDVNDETTQGLRLSLAGTVGDNLELTGQINYQDRDGGARNVVMTTGIPLLGVFTSGRYQVARRVRDQRDERALVASLAADYQADYGTWTSVTSWSEFDVDLVLDVSNLVEFAVAGRGPGRYTQEVFTQEIRLASPSDSRIGWLAGLFYMDQEVPRLDQIIAPDLPQILPLPPDFPDVIFDVRERSERRDIGLFGEVSWSLSARWTATVGARYYDIEKQTNALTTALLRGVVDQQTRLAYSESGVTPKLVLDGDFGATNIYATAAKGFRAGGANAPFAVTICNAPQSYESDDLWSYEIGSKSRWLDDRLSFNAAIYHIDWSDAQQKVRLPDCNNIFIANVGEVTSQGLELEARMLLGERWDIHAAVGYTDSEIAEDSVVAPEGTDIPLIPERSAALGASYRFPLGGRFEGVVRGDLSYTGHSSSNLLPALSVEQPSYTLFNLRFGIESDRWSGALFAENVFDEQARYATGLPTPGGAGGGFSTNVPRRIGIRVRYRF